MLGLVVHVQDLLRARVVECTQSLTGRCVGGLLEVRRESEPALLNAARHARLLIHLYSPLRDLESGVEVVECADEAIAHAMLLIEIDGALDGFVADYVAMCEIFGHNAGAWLVFLCDVLAFVRLRGGTLLAGRSGG